MKVVVVVLVAVAGVAVVRAHDGTYVLDSRGVQLHLGLTPPSDVLQKHRQYSQATPAVYNAFGDTVPEYAWAYEVNARSTGDQKAVREERRGDYVQGQYSVVDPDGLLRVVDYSVAPGTGFKATVNKGTAEQDHSAARQDFSNRFRSQQGFHDTFQTQRYSQDSIQKQDRLQTQQSQARLQSQQYSQDQFQQVNLDQFQNQFSQGQFQDEGLRSQDHLQNVLNNQARFQNQKSGQFQNQQSYRSQFQDQQNYQKEFQDQENYRRDQQNYQRELQDQQNYQREFQDQQNYQGEFVDSHGAQFEEGRRATLYASIPGTHIIMKATVDGSDVQGRATTPQTLRWDPPDARYDDQARRSSFDREQSDHKLRDRSSTEFQQLTSDQSDLNRRLPPVSVILARQ